MARVASMPGVAWVLLVASCSGSPLDGIYFSFNTSGSPADVVDRFDLHRSGDWVTFYRNTNAGQTGPIRSMSVHADGVYPIRGGLIWMDLTSGNVTGSIQSSGDIIWSNGYSSRKRAPEFPGLTQLAETEPPHGDAGRDARVEVPAEVVADDASQAAAPRAVPRAIHQKHLKETHNQNNNQYHHEYHHDAQGDAQGGAQGGAHDHDDAHPGPHQDLTIDAVAEVGGVSLHDGPAQLEDRSERGAKGWTPVQVVAWLSRPAALAISLWCVWALACHRTPPPPLRPPPSRQRRFVPSVEVAPIAHTKSSAQSYDMRPIEGLPCERGRPVSWAP